MANKGMGCYKHPEETVVGTCPKCGKFLCKECADKYESHLCDGCEKERKEKNEQALNAKKAKLAQDAGTAKNEALKSLIIGVAVSLVFGIIGYCAGKADGNGVMMAYMLAGFPWGYRLISKLMDDGVMFFAALAGNFLVAFFIKLVLGMLIGCIAWPIIIGYRIYTFVQANNLHKSVSNK
ncbi:MAG: hypothetical protein IJ093_04185 [Bacilli bacterium]|nr:hypothetical protein [Bacilli bacterium]